MKAKSQNEKMHACMMYLTDAKLMCDVPCDVCKKYTVCKKHDWIISGDLLEDKGDGNALFIPKKRYCAKCMCKGNVNDADYTQIDKRLLKISPPPYF